MNYQQAIEFLQSLADTERANPSTQVPLMPLASMQTFLKHLGNPQQAARTIHVTGSKGKGSTATFIASILKSAGHRTALFTSPHLHSYRERIAFDLEPISELTFAKGVAELQEAQRKDDTMAELTLSTFGFLTALFFYLTSKHSPKVDWQIVEVGLGGATDATNVFATKDIAVITAISLEHTAILGQTTSEITENKAGIITAGCTTILGPQRDVAVPEVVKRVCQERNSTLVTVDEVYKYEGISNKAYGQQFAVTDKNHHSIYQLHMLGKHQIENATTAIAAVSALQSPSTHGSDHANKPQPIIIKESAIRDGLAHAYLPGRFEIFKPKNAKAPTTILDCAHNQDSAHALARTIKETFSRRRCIFVIGVNQDKKIEPIYSELKEICKQVIATASTNPRAMPASDIESRLTAVDAKLKITTAKNVSEALSSASASASANDLICFTGSFYLVAEAREAILANS